MNSDLKIFWTKPFHGIQHLGKCSTKTFWVTVEEYKSFSKLIKWFPGCGFVNPIEEYYDSVDDAKREGEKYLTERNVNIYE